MHTPNNPKVSFRLANLFRKHYGTIFRWQFAKLRFPNFPNFSLEFLNRSNDLGAEGITGRKIEHPAGSQKRCENSKHQSANVTKTQECKPAPPHYHSEG